MGRSSYRARRAYFDRLSIPVSKADIYELQFRQRVRLQLWEAFLNALFFIKRSADILISLIVLVLILPLGLLMALCILVEDGFPVIFVQKRVGLNGREFTMYTFRTMIKGAEEWELPKEAQGGKDRRMLKCGLLFRALHLEELPKLFNVLFGDMTVVGPRAPERDEVRRFSLKRRKRLHVYPGMIHLKDREEDGSGILESAAGLDVQYVESQGFLNDVQIILKAIPAVLLGRGAY